MVDKTIADAVALGIPILHTKGTMIVNIGAQSTEISVIELGKVVVSKLLEPEENSSMTELSMKYGNAIICTLETVRPAV